MRLIEFECKGYKPFSLSNIEHFKWTPQKPLQIILGTNGSGKSSILRASAPTFTNKKEYRKNGFEKSIWEGQDHCRYHLAAYYNSASPKYSFQIEEDGVLTELNEGGTGKIQKELIESRIGYTSDLHELLCQHTKFTTMGPKQRENLMHYLTGNRLDYAYKLFDALRSKHRDTDGAIRHLNLKYEEFCARVNAMGDMSSVIARVKKLEKFTENLNGLTNWSLNNTNPESKVLIDLQDTLTKQTRQAERLEKTIHKLLDEIGKPFPTYEAFLKEREENEKSFYASNERRSAIEKDLNDLMQLVKVLEECPENVDEVGLKNEIARLTHEVEQFQPKWVGQPVTLKQGLNEISQLREQLLLLNAELPTTLKEFSSQEITGIRTRYAELKETLGQMRMNHKALEDRIVHAELAARNDITCPNCGHRILSEESLDQTSLSKYKERLEVMHQKILNQEDQLDTLSESYRDVNDFVAYRRKIADILSPFGWASDIWREQGTVGYVLTHLIMVIQKLEDQIVYLKEGIVHEEHVAKLEKLKEYLRVIQLVNDQHATTRMESLNREYEQLVADSNRLGNLLKPYNELHPLYQSWFELGDQINNNVTAYSQSFSRWIENEKTLAVNEKMKQVQMDLGELRRSLVEYENLSKRRDELAEETKALRNQQRMLRDWLMALSPNKGLIADTIKQTQQVFCDYINRTIDKVWEHPLALRVPKHQTQVDYRFELLVDGEIRDDIALGSSGEQDIINLAVTLAVMTKKGLIGYPLYLDEFGNTFDYVHRANLIRFIEALLRNGTIGQIFMVNHFLTEYGGLEDSDVVVMNAQNIQLGELDYNQVVEMT